MIAFVHQLRADSQASCSRIGWTYEAAESSDGRVVNERIDGDAAHANRMTASSIATNASPSRSGWSYRFVDASPRSSDSVVERTRAPRPRRCVNEAAELGCGSRRDSYPSD